MLIAIVDFLYFNFYLGVLFLDSLEEKPKYMAWPVLGLLVFVTVIGFENILYPFQNQGLSVVFSWVFFIAGLYCALCLNFCTNWYDFYA